MIVDRIKVSIEGYGIWGGFEASISPDENPIDQWIKLKEMVQLAMGQSDLMKGTTIEPVIGFGVGDIESCPDLKTLESYRLLVSKDKVLKDAYDKKFEELKNK